MTKSLDSLTVLVSGGAGYIGSHAVLALRDHGIKTIVIDNLTTGFRWAVPEDVPLIEGDVGDLAWVSSQIQDHDIGAILHFAGSVVVPESVSNPLKYYENNTSNSRALIEAAVTSGVRHFIFSSTAATYGIPDQVPVTEDAPKQPINPYGMSKLMTEHMLADVAKAHVLALKALVEAPTECLTMNCGYGRGFSVTEVLDAVDRVADVKSNRKFEGRRAGDPDALTADNRRIRARLPWTPAYEDLDTIVTHALAWEKELQRRAL